jgi:adenosylmethionine-8-amino-7-oxononanoate aminotransferase
LDEHHNDIAGLFIEPYVQGAAGIIIFPKGFMKGVADICNEYNILFIADEVATGFGKTGNMFACQEDMLTPDIMILAKGISGGYLPLAATLTTDEVYSAFLGEYSEFKAFFHGHTYTGNPVACSAGLASLDVFAKDNTLVNMQVKISLLSKLLDPFTDLDHVGDVRQKGFMVGIDIVLDRKAKVRYPIEDRVAHRICMEARRHQVVIRNLGDVIVLMPPLSITIDELEHLTKVVYDSVINVTKG